MHCKFNNDFVSELMFAMATQHLYLQQKSVLSAECVDSPLDHGSTAESIKYDSEWMFAMAAQNWFVQQKLSSFTGST